MSTAKTRGNIRGKLYGYYTLVQDFPLRPIRTEDELDEATNVMRLLLLRGLDAGEQDYLDVLTNLIEDYETVHHPIRKLSDVEALANLIEQSGTSQTQLAADTGLGASTISEILHGRRKMNRKHIAAFCKRFKVDAGMFPVSE